jgi:hypothetical protein
MRRIQKQPRHNFAAMCAHRPEIGLADGFMISRTGCGLAGLLLLAAGIGLVSGPANAQAAPSTDKADAPAMETEATADPDVAGARDTEIKDTDIEETDIRDLEIDWSQLNVDASTLATSPAKAPAAPRKGAASDMTWSSQDKANGSAAVSVKQPVSPFWDTRIGADMTVTRPASTMSELLSEKIANGGSEPQSSGTAWAAITAPGVATIWDKTAIEARVDPSQDQSKLGTSLSKSLSLSEQYSLTLQNGYNVIQQGTAPVPGLPGRTTRNYETGQSAKLSIAETGTSFSAGQTLSSADEKWLRSIGAEQKLFGGVSISGSISETPFGTSSKSISAGFKQSW